ncbi:MAG: response regulator [Candidatus Liptonbacteria bacterium]|nr:response regulator [Candidatus Liptonbacteria bacterium]
MKNYLKSFLTSLFKSKNRVANTNGKQVYRVDIDRIVPAPIRHPFLPKQWVKRIEVFSKILFEVFPSPIEKTVDNFKRDTHPEEQIEIWEAMAEVYRDYVEEHPNLSLDEKKGLFLILLDSSDLSERPEVIKHFDNHNIAKIIKKLEKTFEDIRKKGLNIKRPKLFLVDDEQVFLEIFTMLFEYLRFKFSTANEMNQETIEKIVSFNPDLISMDYLEPNTNGVEFLKMLKADARTKNYPVVFLSNQKNPDFVRQAIEFGAIDWVAKTEDLSKIEGKLVRIFDNLNNYKPEYQKLIKEYEARSGVG